MGDTTINRIGVSADRSWTPAQAAPAPRTARHDDPRRTALVRRVRDIAGSLLLLTLTLPVLVQRFQGTTPTGGHVIASAATQSPASEVRTLREIASLRSQ